MEEKKSRYYMKWFRCGTMGFGRKEIVEVKPDYSFPTQDEMELVALEFVHERINIGAFECTAEGDALVKENKGG